MVNVDPDMVHKKRHERLPSFVGAKEIGKTTTVAEQNVVEDELGVWVRVLQACGVLIGVQIKW